MNRLVRWAHSCGWVLTFVLCARSAAAQSLPPAPSTTNNDVHFMPRAAFYLWAEKLSGEDEGYEWDANFGGDLDVVDYTTGRLTFYANYQVIMGGEFRRFDPNQGNYILGGTLSRRARNGFEYAFNFHHESRHLSDRYNRVAVAWNMAGGRVSRVILYGPARFDVRVDARVSVAKAFVDYNWEIDSSVRSDVKLRPKVGLLFAGDVRKLGVDGSQNRDGPIGFRAEAGVHFVGGAGAIEFFVAGEHRIDPYPLEFGSINFVTVGFRFLTR